VGLTKLKEREEKTVKGLFLKKLGAFSAGKIPKNGCFGALFAGLIRKRE